MQSTATDTQAPFVGPKPIAMGRLLFGRDREVRTLTDLLLGKRIVLLHAPSGAGKSSLVNAGLIPALESYGLNTLPIIRVNKGLSSALVTTSTGPNRYRASMLQSLEEGRLAPTPLLPTEFGTMHLADYLKRRNAQAMEQVAQVLIFDQFEELLTADPFDLEQKRAFLTDVGEALRDPQLWALFVVRDDYVGPLEPYLQFIPTQLSVRLRLELLTRAAAAEAIQRPARSEAVATEATETFTPEAAERLAGDLSRVLVREDSGSLKPEAGLYVEPLHLQIVCKELWDRKPAQMQQVDDSFIEAAIASVDNKLRNYYSNSEIKKLTAVDMFLADYYARSVQETAVNNKVDEWRVRHWFDLRLITAQNIRGQVMESDETSMGLPLGAVRELIDVHYLARQERRRGINWFELAHDRLVHPIRGDNQRWFQTHLSPFHDRAVRWVGAGQPPDMLLAGADLVEMERWNKEQQGKLTDEEEALLDASRRAQASALAVETRIVDRKTNLGELGWGVIFPQGGDLAIQQALAPLLELRRRQAGALFRELTCVTDPPESTWQFLTRHGVSTGASDPAKMPHYLLIVGGPDQIPFEFQYDLDLQFAVGRLAFDVPEGGDAYAPYAAYAQSVVVAEGGAVALQRRFAVFHPVHDYDRPTQLVEKVIVPPMLDRLRAASLEPAWELDQIHAENATKAKLATLLGGSDTPSLIAAFAYGVEFPPDAPEKRKLQGAIVCQDWKIGNAPNADAIFVAEDVSDSAALLGSIAFLWAGSSAGSSASDDFAFVPRQNPPKPAQMPFIANLPQRLLSHPRGGLLAVCGHVGRWWLVEQGAGEMPVFTEVVRRLMDGYTVGAAMEPFSQRRALFAARASELLRQSVEPSDAIGSVNPELTALLTAMVDARNYIVLGDPAVRLPLAAEASTVQRPILPPAIAAISEISAGAEMAVGKGLTPTAAPGATQSTEVMAQVSPPPSASTVTPLEGQVAAYAELEMRLLGHTPEGYPVSSTLRLPYTDTHVANDKLLFIDFDLDELAGLASDPAAYGRALGKQFFADPDSLKFMQQVRAASASLDIALRVRLIVDDDASELNSLSWETLIVPSFATPLLLDERILFSRYQASADSRPIVVHTTDSLRALVVVANPADIADYGLTPIDVASERERAYGALGTIGVTPLDGRGEANRPTLEHLLEHLRDDPDILYLACHSVMDSQAEPVFILEDEEGHVRLVPAAELTERLAELPQPPRLVLLVPPVSAPAASNELAPLAARLVADGVPAVLVMQGSITSDTLASFTSVFFKELERDGQIDRAVAVARGAVRNRVDWWSPVLFTRLQSGRLFRSKEPSATGSRVQFLTPFMAPALPATYVPRLALMEQVVQPLLAKQPESGAIMVGPAGFGKTSLACAVAHDERVRAKYPGGVLWLTLGQSPNLPRLLDDLTEAVTRERPDSLGLEPALQRWRGVLKHPSLQPLLLILDDAWNEQHVRPFLESGVACQHLVTTRNRAVIPDAMAVVGVDAMAVEEARQLLGANLGPWDPADDGARLDELATRLDRWPLLMQLTTSVLQKQVLLGQPLSEAIKYVMRTLDRNGVIAFDRPGSSDRSESIAYSLQLTLSTLHRRERSCYQELAVFWPGEAIPIPTVALLWQATHKMDERASAQLCDQLSQLSLLEYMPEIGHIRLRPVLSEYLAATHGKELRTLHDQLLQTYRHTYSLEHWADLPSAEPYLWRRLVYHLSGAHRATELRGLLVDFDWLQAKLTATDIEALLADYDFMGTDSAALAVRDALRLAAPILTVDKTQLAAQLLGRLLAVSIPEIGKLLEQAQKGPGAPWLRPVVAGLTPPGVSPNETLAARPVVVALGMGDDPPEIALVWDDGRGAVRDSGTGQEIHVSMDPLRTRGAKEPVKVAVAAVRRVAVTAAQKHLNVWEIDTGKSLLTCQGPDQVPAILSIDSSARYAVTEDPKARHLVLWRLVPDPFLGHNTQHLPQVPGHIVAATFISGDRRVVAATTEGELIVWDLKTTLVHQRVGLGWQGCVVTALAASPQGHYVIAALDNGTVQVWDVEAGRMLATIPGQPTPVTTAAISDDGLWAVTAGVDRTLRLWDVRSVREVAHLTGDAPFVLCSIGVHGKQIAAADTLGQLHILAVEGMS